jgi:DNA repair exonuclease SbcCD ATPase subunit
VQRSNIPAVDGDPEKLEKEISDLKVKRAELEYQLRNLNDNGIKAAKRQQIAEVENEIVSARLRYQESLDAENQKIRDGIARLEAKRRDLQAADDMAASKITRFEGEIETLFERKKAKLDRYHELDKQYKEIQSIQYDGSDTCPSCGQQLPPEKIESAKAKFNADKSNQLESLKSSIDAIIAEGKKLKADMEKKQQEVIDLKSKQESAAAEIKEFDARLEKGRSMLIEGKFEDTDEYKALSTKLNQLKSELESGTDGNELSEKSTELQTQINDIQHKIDAADNTLRFLKQKTDQQKKVNGLMSEEKQIRAEMDNCEKAIALYEEYATAKAKALESAINSKFTSVRFKLFEDVKTTGDERKICKVLLGNGSTEPSTGEKIAAGTEIVTALSKLYGISMPLWIDNAEGLTLPLNTDAQQIRMYVRDDIENLKIEVSEDD